MTKASHRAAAYWAGLALRAHGVFHQALAALAKADPVVAAVTMDAITASTDPFVMRPDNTVGAYPPSIEVLVDLCYRTAFSFQSAVSLIHGVAPHFLAGLARDLAQGHGGGAVDRAADRFFLRAITQVRKI